MAGIHVGYESTDRVYDGGPEDYAVSIPLHHTVITGLTQLSGKTTTIDALVSRLPEDFTALVFQTKRGEIAFHGGREAQPFYRANVDWEYVQSLLEAAMNERLKFERSWIIKATKGAETLRQVYENIQEARTGPRVRGLDESVYTNLAAYFEKVLPELEANPFAEQLSLQPGVNVMNLGHLSEQLQSLVISSCLEEIHDSYKDTVVVIPEAWAFLPQARGNPVKWAAQHVIRQGAANGVYLWLDSQDVTGVDKAILKSVGNWFLGRQREVNEVKRVLAQLPVPSSARPKAEEVMTLPIGHFFVSAGDFCKKVYVQPSWLDDNGAFSVATGLTSPSAVQTEEPAPTLKVPVVDDITRAASFVAADRLSSEVMALTKDRDEWQRLAEGHQKLLEKALGALQEFDVVKEELADVKERLRSLDAQAGPVLALREALLNVLEIQPAPELTESVLNGIPELVANRLGQTLNVVMVAPQEALRYKYQQEALDRLLAKVKTFDEQQCRAIEWLIMTGGYSSRQFLAAELGIPAGGSSSRFSEKLKILVDDGWLLSNSNGIKTRVRERVAAALAPYTEDETQVEETFNHLVSTMAGAKEEGG